MVRLIVLGLVLGHATLLRADSLAAARLARAMLGPGVWSRVLQIENHRSDPRHPLEFAALVFAVEDRLWLYDSHEGTQSLSVYAGRLEQDMANLGPLLRAVLPSLATFRDVTDEVPAMDLEADLAQTRRGLFGASLAYGCFIECLAQWKILQAGPSPPEEAGVLAFYFDTGSGPRGHSVLVYRVGGRRYLYDPAEALTTPIAAGMPTTTPLDLAREIFALQAPFKAHLLALHGSAGTPLVSVATLAAKAKRIRTE